MNYKDGTVLLLSGGLDSVTMLHDLIADGTPTHAVLVNYGQPHIRELDAARDHCARCSVLFTELKIPTLNGIESPPWVVPNRNAILIGLAVHVAARAGAETVMLGCNSEDSEGFPDCRRNFFDATNAALEASEIAVRVKAPFLDMSKRQIANRAMALGISRSSIWSCYRRGDYPCGECPACKKSNAAWV